MFYKILCLKKASFEYKTVISKMPKGRPVYPLYPLMFPNVSYSFSLLNYLPTPDWLLNEQATAVYSRRFKSQALEIWPASKKLVNASCIN